jgi:RHS repeat-associated protein
VIVDNAGTVLGRNDYYPFGKLWEGGTVQAPTTRYTFSGKEKQTVRDLGWLDFSARMLNCEIPIFTITTPDPLAEKYYSISPYAYCLNNPIKYVDPTGMIVEDPDEIYKKHKEQMNNQSTAIQTALKAKDLTDGMKKTLVQLESSYKSILKEYSALEKSDQVYSIFSVGEDGGYTSFEKGKVIIGIGAEDASIGIMGHELKHAYQFETGKVSFMTDGSGSYGTLYDLSDETEAYNRERMLNSGVTFFMDTKSKWTDSDVKEFGAKMNPPAYQTLPKGSININSKQGKALILRTQMAGYNKTPIAEMYNGYADDFIKGAKKRMK